MEEHLSRSHRRVLCVSCGFIITKADLFPVVAARSLGQILLVRMHVSLLTRFEIVNQAVLEHYSS